MFCLSIIEFINYFFLIMSQTRDICPVNDERSFLDAIYFSLARQKLKFIVIIACVDRIQRSNPAENLISLKSSALISQNSPAQRKRK